MIIAGHTLQVLSRKIRDAGFTLLSGLVYYSLRY
jgi:hypothetical protein